MSRLREAGDQSLAPFPHTHRAAFAVSLLPGHLQQDRHAALAHTHQAQGDAIRREGVLVEDGDCPAKEAAAATSAAASAPRAPVRALLRFRVTLTVLRIAVLGISESVYRVAIMRSWEESARSDRWQVFRARLRRTRRFRGYRNLNVQGILKLQIPEASINGVLEGSFPTNRIPAYENPGASRISSDWASFFHGETSERRREMLPEAFSAKVGPVIGAIILIRGANPFDLNGLISDNYLPVNRFVALIASSVTNRRAALYGRTRATD